MVQKQKVIVHLKHGTDDLHAVSMALTLDAEMARKDAAVAEAAGLRTGDLRKGAKRATNPGLDPW